MKRRLFCFAIVAALSLEGFAPLASKSNIINGAAAQRSLTRAVSFIPSGRLGRSGQHQEPVPTIDGSITPDLVPNELAYQAFLRAVNRKGPSDHQRAVSYLRYAFSMGAECCSADHGIAHMTDGLSPDEINLLIGAAIAFNQSVTQIESRASVLRNAGPMTEVSRRQLRQLDGERGKAAVVVINNLRERLSVTRTRQLEHFINQYVKPKMKVY